MTWLVACFGLLVVVLGAVGVVRPPSLLQLAERVVYKPGGFYFAVGVRFALGALLLAAAPECRFPQTISVLGIVTLVAAATIALLGRERLKSFVGWWLERPTGFVRGWCCFAIAFGGFLIYAAV